MKFEDIEPEDISDVLIKVEHSYNIRFYGDELKDVKTFDGLFTIIINKINSNHVDDCTTQQAFYKLSNAIRASAHCNRICPDTKLAEVFPSKERRQLIEFVERRLGFKMNILGPKNWLKNALNIILIGSLLMFILDWRIAVVCLSASVMALYFANRYGKQLVVNTIGELTKKITREHYLQVRRKPGTVNKREIVQKLKELFMQDLELTEAFL
jgi:hypothetical protein